MADYQHFSQQRPHMRKAPRTPERQHPQGATRQHAGARRQHAAPNRTATPRPAAARRPKQRRSLLPIVAGVLVLVTLAGAGFGIYTLLSNVLGNGGDAPAADAGDNVIIEDAASAGPGDIVIGLNGDEDTYVLVGEDYLEAGAHATEPVDGLLNSQIKISGEVDTSKPGDYTVTYTVDDSQGHTATAERRVHVVDEMDTMEDGMPILMYHYIYADDAPPEDISTNHMAASDFEEQLAYLAENDFYFPSYPEIKAFIEGTHSLPANSIALTFDDGEYGFLSVGIPLLEKYQIPATSFIICVDADARQKIIDHRSPYISFQSHGYDLHKPGGSIGHGGVISALTKDEIVADLKQAQEVLGTTEAFAYPFGDVTDDARQAVDEADILCAFTTKNSWAHVGDDVRSLPRVRMSGGTSLEGFIGSIS